MIALFLAQATAHGPNCGVAGAGAGAAAASVTHRLCVFRTSELSLEEGSSLGVGSFGSVQEGQWRGTDVAIKASNCVGGLDSTSLDREREMCVGSAAFAYALGIGDVHALGVLPLWSSRHVSPPPRPFHHFWHQIRAAGRKASQERLVGVRCLCGRWETASGHGALCQECVGHARQIKGDVDARPHRPYPRSPTLPTQLHSVTP